MLQRVGKESQKIFDDLATILTNSLLTAKAMKSVERFRKGLF